MHCDLPKGQVDIPWSQALMGTHGDSFSAVCRHAEIDPQAVTISCVILLPQTSQHVCGEWTSLPDTV